MTLKRTTALLSVLGGIVASTWGVIHKLVVEPRDYEIQRQAREIEQLTAELDRGARPPRVAGDLQQSLVLVRYAAELQTEAALVLSRLREGGHEAVGLRIRSDDLGYRMLRGAHLVYHEANHAAALALVDTLKVLPGINEVALHQDTMRIGPDWLYNIDGLGVLALLLAPDHGPLTEAEGIK